MIRINGKNKSFVLVGVTANEEDKGNECQFCHYEMNIVPIDPTDAKHLKTTASHLPWRIDQTHSGQYNISAEGLSQDQSSRAI